MASLEAAGWNECRPLHRAAAEGNIPVMQLLLRTGVNVNGMDIMRYCVCIKHLTVKPPNKAVGPRNF